MAKIANGKLTYRDLVVAEVDHPLEHFRCSECPRHIAGLDPSSRLFQESAAVVRVSCPSGAAER